MIHSVAIRSYKYVATHNTMKKSIHSKQSQNHPELENLYLIDNKTNTRIQPNNGEPILIDNDIFTGKMLVMIRTSDADQKEQSPITGGSATNDVVSNYFLRKKRRFEIQLQLKFKKVPDSQLFLSCGYENPVKLNLLSKTSLGAALKFCKMKNPTFSYSLSGKEKASEEDKKQGNYENPHFSFPIETSLDRIVITKEGESPPTLGGVIGEDTEARKKREKKGITYNTSDTYTLCLWNAYVDFTSWKAVNLPAVPHFSLGRVNNAQPMSVKVYSLKSNNGNGKHLQNDLETILDVEASHVHATTMLGSGAKQWIERCEGESLTDDEWSISSGSSLGGQRGEIRA